GRFVELDRAYRPRRADPQRRFKHLGRHPNPRVSGKPAEILPTQIFREPKNQGFERPQRRRCGLLHFPAALIRPSLGLR
ncbi:hypothetical protein BRN91_03365, partial [Xanthomonas oryzae pv. oryzae]